MVSGKRDKDAFSVIGYYIFRTKKKLLNFILHQNGLYYKIILFAFKLALPALFKWPKEQGGGLFDHEQNVKNYGSHSHLLFGLPSFPGNLPMCSSNI